MTFNIIVPNQGSSPGIFPAQNNTNFLRLKDIINNDHNFTDSSSLSQGIHKQATFINRNTPVGLPAGNGILYSQADTTGASQLHWYNGATDVQITPGVQAVSGSVSLISTQLSTVFADPGYAYMAYCYASVQGAAPSVNPSNSVFTLATHNANNTNYVSGSTQGAGVIFTFDGGNDLKIKNQSLPTSTFQWTLAIIRLS